MNLQKINGQKSVFETIKQINKEGQEFWFARDFQNILEYKEWRKFYGVIEKAKEACVNSGQRILDHFGQVDKMVPIGSGTRRVIEDVQLSRYVRLSKSWVGNAGRITCTRRYKENKG